MTSVYKIKANYFPPRQSVKQVVDITMDRMTLKIHLDEKSPVSYLFSNLKISERIGNTPCTIKLPDGGLIEIFVNNSLDLFFDTLSAKPRKRFIHLLETRWRYIAAALITITVSIYAVFTIGVPVLSAKAASMIPLEVSSKMTERVMAILDSRIMSPSNLTSRTQKKYTRYFKGLVSKLKNKDDFNFNLIFRKGNNIGANAFALPDGTIIATDELIQIINHKEEFIAVMAHEAGHVVHRHSVRMALQGSIAALLMTYFLGDITYSSIISGMPAILIESGYSRDFERDADLFSYNYLRKQKISPKRFADLLQNLKKQHKTSGKANLFSTHPATDERIRMLEGN